MKEAARPIATAIIASVLYALFIRFLFGLSHTSKLWSVMSFVFLICSPFITGALMVYLSPDNLAKKFGYKVFIPWIPVLIFFILTLVLNIEGWGCWIMVLPLFLIGSSIGGLVGARIKERKKHNRLYISILPILPFVLAPLEKQFCSGEKSYTAYTYIDIHADAETIWKNVTRVSPITSELDKAKITKFLKFPRPLSAELNYEGVGASRKAIFSGGLVFDEVVTEYQHQRKMVFTIKANPYDIPSTTMDKHIVVGGEFFDVEQGIYELEPMANDQYRLHLSSTFKLNTTFNWYASIWARWIMQDIQNNILQVEKARSEAV